MRTIEKTIYTFNELNEKAKEKAREWFIDGYDYSWQTESIESIEAFCNFFKIRLTEWACDSYSGANFEHNGNNSNFRNLKLKNIDRSYMPTGYCLDCDLWITFYDEFKKTSSAKKAFEIALFTGFKSWLSDIYYQQTNEYIDEILIINEYEFCENGDFYS